MRSLLRVVAATALMLTGATAFAGSVSAPMTVSVNVIARAVLTVESQPAAVEVTKADLERGYVDLSTPMIVLAKTNSRAGYLLEADGRSAGFTSVELSFGDSKMDVADSETWISRPYVKGGEVLSIHVRVHLTPGMEPGSYPLGIALTARPL